MAGAISSLYVEFSASTNKFVDAMADVVRSAKEVDKFLKPIKTAAKDVGEALTAGVTVPILALGGAAVAAAVKIDEAMDSIRAQTGKTGAAFETLGNDFRTVLGEVPNKIDDVSKAIGDLTSRTGLAGKPLQDLATQELNLARLTKTEIGETIAASTRVFADWSIATDKQSAALDFLFKTGQQTGIGFSQLSRSVQQFGVPLREMGFSFEQSAVLLGKFEKEGVNSDNVMAALRKSLATLGKAGVTDAAQGFTILIDRIKTAGTVSEANAVAVAGFGSKAGPMLAAAVREGKFSIDELLTSIRKSPDSINAAALATLSLGEKLDIFKNKATLALEPIGVKLVDAFERMIPVAERALGKVSEIAEAFSKLPGGTQSAIVGVGLFAAAVGPALIAIASMSSSLVRLSVMFGAAGISATGFSDAIAGLSILTGARTVQQLSTGISLLGSTSLAATGGLIAVAGAIGVGIGLAANYIIKLTGLQGALDEVVKRTVEIVPGFGKWVTAQTGVDAANKNVVLSTQTMSAELAKHGITVDQTRISEVGYLASLAQQRLSQISAVEATSKHDAALAGSGKAAKASAEDQAKLQAIIDGNTAAAKEFTKRVDEMVDSVTEQTKKGPELVAVLTQLEAKHVDLSLIVEKLGKDTIEYNNALLKNGQAIPPVIAGIAAATLATEEQNAANARAFDLAVKVGEITEKNGFELKQQMIDNAAGRADLTRVDEQYTANLSALIELQTSFVKVAAADQLKSRIDLINDELKADTDYASFARDSALAISQAQKEADDAATAFHQTTLDIRAAMDAGADQNTINNLKELAKTQATTWQTWNAEHEKLQNDSSLRIIDEQKKASQQWQALWTQATRRLSSDFASAVTSVVFSGRHLSDEINKIFKDLAESILKIMVQGLFTKLISGFQSVLGGLAGKSGILGQIGSLFGGGGAAGGAKGLLSLFGGGGGAVAGLLGGGGAALPSAAAMGLTASVDATGAITAGATTAGVGGGLGASIGALATNPITIAAAGALAAGLLIKHYVGQGRRTANEFVQGTQNPFGQNLSAIVDAFDSAQKAGTLTADTIQQSKDALTQLWSAFKASADDFGAQGATQQKVVNQAYATLDADFGANLSNLFAKFDAATAALSKGTTTAANGSTASTTVDPDTQSIFITAIKSFGDWVAKLTGSQIPVTGVATSASQILATSASQLAAAVNSFIPRLTGAVTGTATNVTLNSNVVSNVTIDGTKLTALEIRDTIETQIVDDVKNDIRGMRAGLLDALGLA